MIYNRFDFLCNVDWDKLREGGEVILKKLILKQAIDKEKSRVAVISFVVFLLSSLFLISCSSIDYLWHVSRGQMSLLNSRISIEKALKKYNFSENEKKKLQLVSEIKTYATEKLKMDINEDLYSSYVHLDRPYVSYLLRVSSAYELKAYEWDFPVIGSAPYKGYFDKEKAKEAAEAFSKEEYDTYLRGVSAYSTLGWFDDPVFSTMLSYSESDFVVMIFHELVHTVLFFKDHINFNERFAEFTGRKAAVQFYLEKKGQADSEIVKKMNMEWEDELLFSFFMMVEYEALDQWYKNNKGKVSPEMKQTRLEEIQSRFLAEVQPNLKTDHYNYFSNITLNNALLLSYRSYNYNMAEFEKLFVSPLVNKNIKAFIEYCIRFEKEENPEEAFSRAILQLPLTEK